MKSEKTSIWKKLNFWKTSKDDILDENELDAFFKSLFVSTGSEKEMVLDIIEKRNIKNFLFYTDVRNVSFILNKGILPANQISVDKHDRYYVWEYHQKQDSINLDFDISTRAHFWKWAADVNIKTNGFCVFGIDPTKLSKTTKRDWIFDRSFGMINIIEPIQVENINWILIRDEQYYKYIKKIIDDLGLEIEIYLSHNGMVKIGE